ncbi:MULTISPECIES: acyl-ACP--UDP-N-acetylglucosamine O-acyltransferase [unclassified Azospirillum]|uniref:acyl-ACP--UDP-N-acetylglucosamine O-acyltransferase n=1 Tax=unclassified Azospirillum TaxID=2630922 RepID=UPI000B755E4E|nr:MULTISPECIES: acyl-ACP--UDP-N-acetylglucosamine O-acyltransferase [unclassified Azospirillum]SNS98864.1 acyl-[acyl-carrier-protein]--UDP-N-acetylglucosamine O-acyltransferase [Azospirillum sp. RU38E]SNT15168.1 acyl-[acyl-carrier-protein]--UDP-N-acetylglucosamine O-acyltransferase [Azospirillum sp. RU37A]
MTSFIHPSAIVDSAAQIGNDVHIGPFCVVGPDVVLGDHVRLVSHVAVDGRTRIGPGTVVYPFASLGHPPQDLKYKGEPSELIIGSNNKIREQVTMNPGTEGGGMVTRVGNGGLFMVGVHIGHDCIVGDNVIFANNATLGGHVEVGDYAVLGGLSAVHQWVRIGAHAMIGGMSGVEADVIPYGLVKGERAFLAGLNLVGLERRGFNREQIGALRNGFKRIFTAGEGTMAERMEAAAAEFADSDLVAAMLDFLAKRGSRALTLPR